MKTISPWGTMWKLLHLGVFWLKVIHVNKGHRTSLQYHFRRVEIHFTFFGVRLVLPKQEHRMEEGWYLELAFGWPRENDIVRLQDDYGR